MATAGLTTKPGTQVAGYDIDPMKVLGRGAFGTVHPATDRQGRQLVVKRIDGDSEAKLTEVTRDLKKLVHLDHKNVINVLDVHQEATVIWIFMEFCQWGDLNKYLAVKSLSEWEKIRLMLDTAKGVEYLHSKNIIHRDIKPANVLVSGGDTIGETSVVAKLTDFDVSKFLDEDYDTSVMTSDVGTKAFKAPEFWMRNAQGQLNYHRNVDVYAMGLAFLSLIQENNSQKLIPKIETPNEASEKFQNIGGLIAERVKFKVKPLDIIPEETVPPGEKQNSFSKIRTLIRQMTKVKPEERISAPEVVQELVLIKVNTTFIIHGLEKQK